MTSAQRLERIKALPKPLGRLLMHAERAHLEIFHRMDDHKEKHGCHTGPRVEPFPGDVREYCPVYQMLMDAWYPMSVFAGSLEWLLIGGDVPLGFTSEFGVEREARS
jgi:hypothetical protein